jgi:hypothetical protein
LRGMGSISAERITTVVYRNRCGLVLWPIVISVIG